MSVRRQTAVLLAPVLLIVGAALVGSLFARPTEIYFINAFVATTAVVALYIFVGNSGVLSFGHISFVAVGAWAAGVLSVPVSEKAAIYTNLFPFLAETTVGNAYRNACPLYRHLSRLSIVPELDGRGAHWLVTYEDARAAGRPALEVRVDAMSGDVEREDAAPDGDSGC